MIFYNVNDKQKALDLANKLEFENINITNNHMETSLVLFMDDLNGTWTIDGSHEGRYTLNYEGERIEVINKDFENELDIFVEDERNSDEREQHEEECFRDHQEEMLRNTNRNHF